MTHMPSIPGWSFAHGVRQGQRSPVAPMQSRPSRIDALNSSRNAVLAVRRDESRADAAALQRRLVARKTREPLAEVLGGGKTPADASGMATVDAQARPWNAQEVAA